MRTGDKKEDPDRVLSNQSFDPETREAISVLSKKLNIIQSELSHILAQQMKPRELELPSSIFSDQLGSLEAICKYLKENRGMSFHEIAVSLGRSDRGIWLSYRDAARKLPERFTVDEASLHIPVRVLTDRRLSVLESLVRYLRSKDLRFTEIGILLARDQRNIWTINKRAERKLYGK